MTYFVFLIS